MGKQVFVMIKWGLSVLLFLTACANAGAFTYDVCMQAIPDRLFPGYEPLPSHTASLSDEVLPLVRHGMSKLNRIHHSDVLYIYKVHSLATAQAQFAQKGDEVAEVVVCNQNKRLVDLVWFNMRTKEVMEMIPRDRRKEGGDK